VLLKGGEGVLDTTTLEGIDALTGFTHSSLSGWSVAVGLPKTFLTKPLWRSVVVLTGFGALCLAIGTILATRLAARVARTEAERGLLINELNHRVKNTLATVQSMATNTLKTSPSIADARQAMEARLMAMALVHDVLTEEHWKSADLGELLNSIVDPYRTFQSRIHLQGPDLRLEPRAAMTMAMVINELTTNAEKYGALSRAEGALTLVWSIVENGNPPTLHLIWQEAGGPGTSPPKTRGFGSVLIEKSVVRELKGSVVMQFEPGGLVCTIEIPLQGSQARDS
jgi:two-component sensor histidine kinase